MVLLNNAYNYLVELNLVIKIFEKMGSAAMIAYISVQIKVAAIDQKAMHWQQSILLVNLSEKAFFWHMLGWHHRLIACSQTNFRQKVCQ